MAFPGRNLLILLPHGLRSDALSDARCWPMSTPRMLALAQRGLRLQAVAASPVDRVAGASLFTGLHARQHGSALPQQVPALIRGSFLEALAEAGYELVGAGCVGPVAHQLTRSVVVAEPDQVAPAQCAYFEHLHRKAYATALSRQREQRARTGPLEPERLLLDAADDIDGFITRRAVELLGQMPEDRPWALVVAYSGPGNDLPPPTLYEELVSPALLQDGFALADFRSLDAICEPAYPRALFQRLQPHLLGQIRSDYLGRVALIDHGVGVLEKQVAQRADAQRVWTVLGSDRGHLLGEQGLTGPGAFLDGGVQTPLIIAPPRGWVWERPLQNAEPLCSTVDLAATVAALARTDLPVSSAGRSQLFRFAEREENAPPSGMLSEWGERLMWQTPRWKALFRSDGTLLAAFDRTADLEEGDNQVERLSPDIRQELLAALGQALLGLRSVGGIAACSAGSALPV